MGKISECAEWAHPKMRRVIFTWNFRFGIVAQHDVTTFLQLLFIEKSPRALANRRRYGG